jgi:hypothetical protein
LKAKWVQFVLVPCHSLKTNLWRVFTIRSDDPLGEVRWYAPWRKYAFFPLSDTLYEPTCLRDIAQFIEDEMKKRKAARRK